MLPAWASIVLLSLTQGTVVALPRAVSLGRLGRLGGRAWALVPPLSVILFVVVTLAAERASVDALTYLALVAVPVLAALALAWASAPARPVAALLVPALFAVAWADRSGVAGQACAVALTALSCVTLGAMLASVTPPRWLAAGIVAMAVADTFLVVSNQLQQPNGTLTATHPAAGLPRLQAALLGGSSLGYGDLFAAAVLGALLVRVGGRRAQLRGAALTALLALAMDALFFVVDELPATVPVATALLIMCAARRRSARRRSRPPAAPARAPVVPQARAPAGP